MAMISEIEQETQDFDWFFTNGEEIAFVASGGGQLPASVAASKESLEALWDFFFDLEETNGAITSPNLKKHIPKKDINARYTESFALKARKGLYAYDKTLNNFSNTNYHLVAIPSVSLKLADLPKEIAGILTLTFNNSVGLDVIDVSLIK